MEFRVYTPEELAADPGLVDSFLDIITQNLSWLFGEDMDSDENRDLWKRNNLFCDHPVLHAVVGIQGSRIAGFIHYSIRERKLEFHEFEVPREHRFDAALVRGLLRTLFRTEFGHFDRMQFYINRKNALSLSNFAKYASFREERPRGYSFLIDEEKTGEILSRFLEKHPERRNEYEDLYEG